MLYVKSLNQILNSRPYLVSIRGHSSFAKTFRKIKKAKKIDFIWVEKPVTSQMAAVLLWRMLGKKFLWIQNFTNPPTPNLFTKLILSQADKIIVQTRGNFARLKKSGMFILLMVDSSPELVYE